MKKFIIKASGWLILIVGVHLYLGTFADGKTDPYYLRFTTPKQSSLIIGTSRAAQGIVPSILDSMLNRQGHFYNFSFTLGHSPFGATYLNAIKRKKLVNETGTINVIAVDPWSLAINLLEDELALGNTKVINMNPNYLYLLKNYEYGWLRLITETQYNMELKQDGWLEVHVSMDSLAVARRKLSVLRNYEERILAGVKTSSERIRSFMETIEFLKENGSAVVVRLPVTEEMLQLENDIAPNFNYTIDSICKTLQVDFWDFSKTHSKYKFTDAHHLFKESSKEFTKNLASKMLKEGL
ncbi:MAG: hypothetical protein JXR03_06900 [Cyclobacteriaceae bacterium]